MVYLWKDGMHFNAHYEYLYNSLHIKTWNKVFLTFDSSKTLWSMSIYKVHICIYFFHWLSCPIMEVKCFSWPKLQLRFYVVKNASCWRSVRHRCSDWGIILSLKRTVRSVYFSFKLVNYTGPFECNIKAVLRFFGQLLMFNYSVTNNKSGHFLNSICLLKAKLNYSQLPNERLRHESHVLDSRARVYRKLSTNRTLRIWAARKKICSRCSRVPSVPSVWETLAASWERLH